jgi:hypothetical protein
MSKKDKATGIKVPTAKTPESTTPVDAPAPIGLSVGDLKKMVQIIQICSKRGAFEANEMAQVGSTYTNLVNFLVSSGAIPKAGDPAATPDTAPAVDVEAPTEATPSSTDTMTDPISNNQSTVS